MKVLNVDDIFKRQMYGMYLSGVQPDAKRDIYWISKFIIYFGFYVLYVYFLLNSIINHDLRSKDYFNAFRNAVPIVIFIGLSSMVLVILIQRKILSGLLQNMRKDYLESQNMEPRLHAVIEEYAMKGLWISNHCLFVISSSIVMFILKSAVVSIYIAYKGEYRLVHFHELHYPRYIEERKDDLPMFTATYIGELYYTSTCSLLYFSTVPIGPIFMLHVSGQLELIRIKFENVFAHDDVEEKLSEIAKQLQYVYSFVRDINSCFTLVYEVNLKLAMFLLPLLAYAIVKSLNTENFAFEYFLLMGATFLMSACSCFYGDLLMAKGEEVRQGAYACGWERVHISSARKKLLIIITRALRPVAIKSTFNILCLDTLTNVLRQSYTIFNLLTAMWD